MRQSLEKEMEYRRRYYQENKDRYRDNTRRWRKANPERWAALHRQHHFSKKLRDKGLSEEQYWNIWAEQGEKCGICGGLEPGKRTWCLDHAHGSGKVRGILCHSCNLMLGQAKDRPSVLHAGAIYLEERA